MRVLVTRAAEDAAALRDELAAMKIDSVLAPVHHIAFVDPEYPPEGPFLAVLVTSRNGADALPRYSLDRDIPVFAVGDATAERAKAHGFSHVESADGDAAALAEHVRAVFDPEAGPLLFLSAEIVAGDLAGLLGEAGFDLRRVVAYRNVREESLPDEALEALREGTLDGALFFSSSAGRAFVSLVEQAGLTSSCREMTAYCLSGTVAGSLEDLDWKAVKVAPRPTKRHLLALLARPCHKDA